MIVSPGATNVSIDVQIVNDSGIAVTGLLAANWPAVKVIYGANEATLVLSDLSDPDDDHADGGVLERSGGGWYRLDLPDAPFAAAIGQVVVCGEASGKHVIAPPIQVKDIVPATILPIVSVMQDDGKLTKVRTEAYQDSGFTHVFAIVDRNGDPVDLSGKSIVYTAYRTLGTTDFQLTTADGEITVGGADNNQVTVTSDNSNTGTAGEYKFNLRNMTDDTMLARGTLLIAAEQPGT